MYMCIANCVLMTRPTIRGLSLGFGALPMALALLRSANDSMITTRNILCCNHNTSHIYIQCVIFDRWVCLYLNEDH